MTGPLLASLGQNSYFQWIVVLSLVLIDFLLLSAAQRSQMEVRQ